MTPTPAPLTVRDALARARAQGVDRLDAQLLLAHHLGVNRSWLIAHDDEVLSEATRQAVETELARRASGVPLAYLLGEREFHGLRLAVSPAVLVPRPETEHLVDWALERLAGVSAPRVLDLGTGSGAIAIAINVALARMHNEAQVIAVDVSADALAVAQANARALGARVQFEHGSWWQPVQGQLFDLVVSNPPYIAADDAHLAALRHEPLQALTPGGDGLDALRAIIAEASTHLHQGAWLLLEHGHDQGQAVRTLLAQAGLAEVQTRCDLAGLERCSGGRRPAG